jgi:hypothetical protein
MITRRLARALNIPPQVLFRPGTKTSPLGSEHLINACCWINKPSYLHLPLVCVMGIYWRASLVRMYEGRAERG